jgi:pimeloyl-ACP methyl ester carboxylesterase
MAVRWATNYDDVANTRGIARLLAAVPDAEVVVLDDVSHNFVMLSPDVVVRVVDDFLRRIEQ